MPLNIHFASSKTAFFENHEEVKRGISPSDNNVNLHIFPYTLLSDFDFLQTRFGAVKGCHFASDLEVVIGLFSAKHASSDWRLVSTSLMDGEFSMYEIQQQRNQFKLKKQVTIHSSEQPIWAENIFRQSSADVEKINKAYQYWKGSGCVEETNLNLGQYFQPAETEVFSSSLSQYFSRMLATYETTDLIAFLSTDALLQFEAFRDAVFERWSFLRQQADALLALNAVWAKYHSDSIWAWFNRNDAPKHLTMHFSKSRVSTACSLRYGSHWLELPGIFQLRLDTKHLNQHFSMQIDGQRAVSSQFPIKNYLPDEVPDFVYGNQPYKMLRFSLCFDHMHYLFLKTNGINNEQPRFGLLADVSDFV